MVSSPAWCKSSQSSVRSVKAASTEAGSAWLEEPSLRTSLPAIALHNRNCQAVLGHRAGRGMPARRSLAGGSVSVMAVRAGRYELTGRITLRTSRDGLAAQAGHDLTIDIGSW